MLESIDFLAFLFSLFFTHVVDWLRLGEVDVNLDGFEDLGSESQLLREEKLERSAKTASLSA